VSLRYSALLLCGLALYAPPAAGAYPIDGTLDAGYGILPLATQTTQTGQTSFGIVGDNTLGETLNANGSELDEAYGVIRDGGLQLFFTGNLAIQPNPVDPGTLEEFLLLFVDTGSGGQHVVSGIAPVPPFGWLGSANGLTFDAGFDADYGFDVVGNTLALPPNLGADQVDLTGAGTRTAISLGSGSPAGPGTLSGGTNPHGILMTLDNHNTAGVTFGCGAASGVGVTTGIEWVIPLTAIGNPTDCVKVCAIVVNKQGSISNQVLGPVPAGTCPLGPASGVDFSSIAGNQYFTVCPGSVPVHAATWGELKAVYR
jgi:hypothetical protein